MTRADRRPNLCMVALAGAVLALRLGSVPAHGQAGLFWSPPTIDLAVPSGGSASFRCDVINTGGSPGLFRIFTVPMGQKEDGTYHFPLPGEEGAAPSCADWISAEPNEVLLAPGESAAIACSVQVPRRERGGGRYAGVLCQLVPEAKLERDDMLARMQIQLTAATTVMLNVANRRPQVKAKMSQVTVTQAEDGGMVFEGAVENFGNTHIYGKGTLVLRDTNGRRLAATQLGSGRGTVLPGTTVLFRTLVKEPLPIGDYIAEARVEYGPRGRATAQAPFSVRREMLTAATSAGLAVVAEPAVVEKELPPGALRTDKLTILNLDEYPIHVTMRAADLSQDVLGHLSPAEPEEGIGKSAADLVSIRKDEFDILPGRRATVPITITVPEESEAGGYYAAIVAEATADVGAESPANTTVFSSLLLNVTGSPAAEVEVVRADLEAPSPEQSPVAQVLVRNPSDRHVSLFRLVLSLRRLTDEGETERGEKARRLEADLSGEVVLPGVDRVFMVQLAEALEPGPYVLTVQLAYVPERNRPAVVTERTFGFRLSESGFQSVEYDESTD